MGSPDIEVGAIDRHVAIAIGAVVGGCYGLAERVLPDHVVAGVDAAIAVEVAGQAYFPGEREGDRLVLRRP